MVTTWEAPHSNPKEITAVLSFQAGTRHRDGLFNDDGYMQELGVFGIKGRPLRLGPLLIVKLQIIASQLFGVFGIKGPTQYSNMFGRPTLTVSRAA